MITPFKDMIATDLSPEIRAEYFVRPKYINKLINGNAQFIVGERGSGKTTVLQYLESKFNHDENHDYLGIYFRFETARMKSLLNQNMNQEENIVGFSQSIVAILGKQFCETLIQIRESSSLLYEREHELCERIFELFYEKNDQWERNLYGLYKAFEEVRSKTWRGIRNEKVPTYMLYTDLLDVFATELRKEKCFSCTCVCILLDEYENITPTQQRVINSLVKSSSYFLTYKICMRPEGFRTKLTLSDHEQLMVIHDYESVDYVKDIIGDESDVRDLICNMCGQRLKYFYTLKEILFEEKNLDIENYLETVGRKEEIKCIDDIYRFREETIKQINDIVGYKVPMELLDKIGDVIDLYLLCIVMRKKNSFEEAYNNIISRSQRYYNWRHNYEGNIVYIILDYYEKNKIFCGLDVIIKLSHNNLRVILWILHYAFGEQGVDVKTPYSKINAERQNKAIRKVSEEFYDEINPIPFYGPEIEALADSLGSLFRSCLMDKQAKKFEVNHFSIRKRGFLDERKQQIIKNILKDATMWGVFIAEKTNKSKAKDTKYLVYNNSDYILNPILSPYYEISYRKKQKCELWDDEFFGMMRMMTHDELSTLQKEISDDSRQMSIWEYMDETVQQNF